MFSEVHTPEQLPPGDLDRYLARGWFRMDQTIFTTNFLQVDGHTYSTLWLRIVLADYSPDRVHRKLIRQNDSFETVIGPAVITPEKEELYALYKQSVPFRASASLHHLLFSDRPSDHSIYATQEVIVRDNGRLIACGFFDLGESSAQGIVSFYDPEYSRFSPGKYLVYRKIQFCSDRGMQYFYPGYFVPGNPRFDYKLSIGRAALQFLRLSTAEWSPIGDFSEDAIPLQVMQDKLKHLRLLLDQMSRKSRVLNYAFFDINLLPQLQGSELLQFPVFLYFSDETEEKIEPIVVFDVRDSQYHLLASVPVWKINEPKPDVNYYAAYFLSASNRIFATDQDTEMAAYIGNILHL